MTRIDFYIIDSSTPQVRENFACRLIDKAQSQGHSIFVQSHSPQHAELLDNLLWTFKPASFVTHSLSDSSIAKNCSVVIGNNHDTNIKNSKNDVLINFDTTVPDAFSQYGRVIEIVNKQDDSSVNGRIRYKFYKDRGYKMESHNIRG